MPLGLKIGAASWERNTSWTARAKPGVVHARKTTEQTRKADGHEGVLPLRPVDRDQAVLIEEMEGVEVEVAAEQRAARGALLRRDDQRRAGDVAIDVGQRVGQDARVAVDARLLGERPQLLAVIGRNLVRQRLAHLQVFWQAVLVARPLQQPPRIVGDGFSSPPR